MKAIETIVAALTMRSDPDSTWGLAEPIDGDDPSNVLGLSAAFLSVLAGSDHTTAPNSLQWLERMCTHDRWGVAADFFLRGLTDISAELDRVRRTDPEAVAGLDAFARLLGTHGDGDPRELAEAGWNAFFPEGVGIRGREDALVGELREQRTVTIDSVPTDGMTDPGRQVLFTANALLTVPHPGIARSQLSGDLRAALAEVSEEPQVHWYDHPVPIDTTEAANEILHGLRGLDEAIAFEKRRGVVDASVVLPVVLSVSVTHQGLTSLARRYMEDLLQQHGGLKHIDVYVFTEPDARRMTAQVLAPAAARYLDDADVDLLEVVGVDGRYGRHYSFLKAIAAWWQVMVDPDVKATFKIDLDQVFDQEALVAITDQSAFEHLVNALWGATGTDADGQRVELGMVAGSLVNQSDIAASLFTPDMTFPQVEPTPDELVFWSVLPQALSTAAEMGTRYGSGDIDGRTAVVERVHVTGGTTGIRVDALRRHRPFTPSFVGRAEDQAYLLSTYGSEGTRLACLHADGLVMRHDKDRFATDAVLAAAVGKLIGDYERIVLFSAYARAIAEDVESLKGLIDPFTGCFVSRMPVTVTYLRFALRAIRFFAEGDTGAGLEFTVTGAERIGEALRFVAGSPSPLDHRLAAERAGWELYYDALDALERGLVAEDPFAIRMRDESRRLLDGIVIRAGRGGQGARSGPRWERTTS